MFKIQDGRNKFYQWDINRKLVIEDASVSQIHYCNKTGDCSLVCEVYEENNQRVADVPNILLQSDWRINVYAYDKNHTKHSAVFQVVARTKPADYVYTETEIVNYAAIDKRITALEESGIPEDEIKELVENYLDENPVEAGATAEQAAQIEANTTAIKELQDKEVNLDGYATEEYVDDAIAAIELPTGGGGEWKHIRTVVIPEDITTDTSGVAFSMLGEGCIFAFDTDENGNSFEMKEIICRYNAGISGENPCTSGALMNTATPKFSANGYLFVPVSFNKKGSTTYGYFGANIIVSNKVLTYGAYNGGSAYGNLLAYRDITTRGFASSLFTAICLFCQGYNGGGFTAGSTFEFYGR